MSELSVRYEALLLDCRNYLQSPFAPNFDFIFADPPFNIKAKYANYEDNLTEHEYLCFSIDWLLSCWNKLKPGAAMVAHASIQASRHILKACFQLNLDQFIEQELCWAYNFGECNFHRFIETHCRAIVLRKPGSVRKWYVENVLTESKRLLMGDKRVLTSKYGGYIPYGTVWGLDDVDGVILEPLTAQPNWGRVQGNKPERRSYSPNQLPQKYVERCLFAFTEPGDLVFDPFAGSGTTIFVSKTLNRSCITTDISEVCINAIKQTLSLK